MMSMRHIARAAPRTVLSRLSLRASTTTPVRTSLLKATAAAAKPSPFPSSALRAFSTTISRRAGAPAGETDQELVAKLESEIQFEEEVKDNEAEPASVKDFLENSPFELKDSEGQETVTLERTYGNEKITVKFSIADLAAYDPDGYSEDPALADEGAEEDGSAPESQNAASEGEEEDIDDSSDDGAGVVCSLNVIVEKPNIGTGSGVGALGIEATAQHGQVTVSNVYFYKDASLAHAATAEAQQAAQSAYPGPPFGTLDEDLQILIERYLEERGVTQALAVFVPDYMDVKEQREYLNWLVNIKNFIQA